MQKYPWTSGFDRPSRTSSQRSRAAEPAVSISGFVMTPMKSQQRSKERRTCSTYGSMAVRIHLACKAQRFLILNVIYVTVSILNLDQHKHVPVIGRATRMMQFPSICETTMSSTRSTMLGSAFWMIPANAISPQRTVAQTKAKRTRKVDE